MQIYMYLHTYLHVFIFHVCIHVLVNAADGLAELQAYSPLARGKKFQDPTLCAIAKKHTQTGPNHWAMQMPIVVPMGFCSDGLPVTTSTLVQKTGNTHLKDPALIRKIPYFCDNHEITGSSQF